MGVQYCSSYSLETLKAIHDFENDTIKLALYDSNASFSASTTAYTATNEVSGSGTGYTTGGATLSLSSGYPQLEDGFGSVRFETASWTLVGNISVQWALMYNSSKSNRAILSIYLPGPGMYTSEFNIKFPTIVNPIVQHRFGGV